jgi:hypothetical protein
LCSSSAHRCLDLLSRQVAVLAFHCARFAGIWPTGGRDAPMERPEPATALAPALMLCLAPVCLHSAALPILWFSVSRRWRRTRGLAPEILAHLRGTERSRRAQGTHESPPALRTFQAFLTAVQVRTAAGQPRPGVRDQMVPGRDKAEQAGFGRTLPAAHAGAHRRHAPRGPRGRSVCHSIVPARPQRRAPRPHGGRRGHPNRARRASCMRQPQQPRWRHRDHQARSARQAGHRT